VKTEERGRERKREREREEKAWEEREETYADDVSTSGPASAAMWWCSRGFSYRRCRFPHSNSSRGVLCSVGRKRKREKKEEKRRRGEERTGQQKE
jgi:hypothetical protein